ncbi:MAG: methyltransferase domain-containing protein, partial [Desulfobacterales bacterium]|nr:methyltransferase domain-containing protein [Desulfobacterales bacterium]
MIFPGEYRIQHNVSAWKTFWNQDRIRNLTETMKRITEEIGFTSDAFNPFLTSLSQPQLPDKTAMDIPEECLNFLGISLNKNQDKWIQFSTLSRGSAYQSGVFYDELKSDGKIFDPAFFSQRFSHFLFVTFIKITVVIGIGITLMLFFYFLDVQLTLISMLPVIFALISTLGTLNIIGHPLDIPILMLSIMVIGTGIEYAVFFVISYQRYGDATHPSFVVVRIALFMIAGTTLTGLGGLSVADHILLRSVGLISLLGIGYSFIGSFLLVPPLIEYVYKKRNLKQPVLTDTRKRVLYRYQNMETYIRMFVRCKMKWDSLFDELPKLLDMFQDVHRIMDIGCGYGIPACWLLETYPHAHIYGIEPDIERVYVASRAVGHRGHIECGYAPNIPQFESVADLAIMVDVVYYLTDTAFLLTLQRIHESLKNEGCLVMRVTTCPPKKPSWLFRLQDIQFKLKKIPVYYRSIDQIQTIIQQTNFTVQSIDQSHSLDHFFWIVCKPR